VVSLKGKHVTEGVTKRCRLSHSLLTNSALVYTVTRPYAGFRHPDRMAPDQMVRGGENYCFIWSGNFPAQVPKFSSIFWNPGIFLRFTWSSVRRVPFLCWFFTFLGAGRHFRNFPEIYPVKKWKSAHGGIQRRISRTLLRTSTSTPQLPYMKVYKI
jgi:hypothetical protein